VVKPNDLVKIARIDVALHYLACKQPKPELRCRGGSREHERRVGAQTPKL
jgi:hypothetical protein